MNIIWKLFEEDYVKKLFEEKVLPQYPDFKKIKNIKISAPKKHIWENTYHVVIAFNVFFVDKNNQEHHLPIYCSAHSDEPRKNVYDVLKYLWSHGFDKGNLTIPHPLFYSEKFRGTFYRGVEGKNLYHYIRQDDKKNIEAIIPKTADWFVKLHSLSTFDARNFNKENSRIKTVIPGKEHILERIKKDYPQYFEFYKKAYDNFIQQERDFFSKTCKRYLVHGDAHPENVIKMSERKIAVIDFTDLSLADFARDLGTFLQQVEYMIMRKIEDKNYAQKIKDLFLNTYLKNAKIKLDDNLQKRIKLYYNWTSIRTATFFLLKKHPEPERAEILINKLKDVL